MIAYGLMYAWCYARKSTRDELRQALKTKKRHGNMTLAEYINHDRMKRTAPDDKTGNARAWIFIGLVVVTLWLVFLA